MVIDKLWSGRFSESVDAEAEAFTASHSFDRRLVEQDILGSCAHAKMLLHCGILTKNTRRLFVSIANPVRAALPIF